MLFLIRMPEMDPLFYNQGLLLVCIALAPTNWLSRSWECTKSWPRKCDVASCCCCGCCCVCAVVAFSNAIWPLNQSSPFPLPVPLPHPLFQPLNAMPSTCPHYVKLKNPIGVVPKQHTFTRMHLKHILYFFVWRQS